jgi:glycosyltransferase involved in cell wall biosynthesis
LDYFSNWIFRTVAFPFVWYLRTWDKIAAARPDKLIAISKNVSDRIKKYYGLQSEIAYPPLMMRPKRRLKNNEYRLKKENHQSSISNQKSYFLVVSRLVSYKRIDIAVKAANRARVPLKIIGTGSEMANLKRIAGPTVEFLGYVSDSDLKYYYANCRALIFPGIEDFGLTMVEAQATGKPVIAFAGGGASEIIISGRTGKFFDRQNSSSLAAVLKSFRSSRYNSYDCIKNARRFSFELFRKRIEAIINEP